MFLSAFWINKIDFHDTRDIFEKSLITVYTGNLRTLYEIENQVQSQNYLKAFIAEKKAIDIEFIKKLIIRYIVKEERPGEFKKYDYVIGINEVGSPLEKVEQDLIEFLDKINGY